MRTFLSVACMAALLAGCGRGSKPQPSAQTPPAQVADATPADPQSRQVAEPPLDENGQPAGQPASPAQPGPAPAPAQPAAAATANPPAAEVPPSESTQALRKPSAARPSPGATAPQPAPVPDVAADVVGIPAGTLIRVRLEQTIGTRHNRPGDRFQATLMTPLVVRGQMAVPRGTLFEGHVVEARPSGRLKGRAVLSLALDGFWMGGVRHPVNTSADTAVSRRHRKRNWFLIGGGSGLGATLGAVAGGGAGALIGAGAGAGAGTIGALITGKRNVSLHAETPLTFRLRREIAVQPVPRPS